MTRTTNTQSIPKPRLIRIYHRSMLLTMLGSIGLFALADLSPSFLLIGLVGSCIGYWYASQGPSTISRIAINSLLAVVVVLGLVNAMRGNFSVSSFAFFSLLLLILKLFDLRTPRDHGQILVLSLGLIIASALTSNSMPVGLGVLVMGFVIVRALMLFRLYALTTTPASKNEFQVIASIDLRSMQAVTGFVCSVVAVMIFMVMPRSLGNNTLGQWGGIGTQTMTTGFAEDVELGRPGRITTSPTPVLRMTIRDRNDQPIGNPNSRAFYLRGAVLTQYEEGRWVGHKEQNVPITFRTRIIEQDQSLPIVNDNSRSQWTSEYHITFESDKQYYGYLFTPWKPLELRTTERESRVGIDPDTRMILLSRQPISSYRVRAMNPEFSSVSVPPDSVRPPVDTQGITPRMSALAVQILTRAGIDPNPETRPVAQDIQAVRAIENHLRTQFTYTLESEPVPKDEDATDWFLFERQTGHCEYYASALTLLTRSVGIPARVITGFIAAEYNEVTGSYTVRESNAHAWAEAMVAPDFWRTFDGTPQEDFHSIHEREPTLLRTISKFYEAIEHAWVKAVIGYDSDSRASVFGNLDPDLGLSSYSETLQNRLAAGRGRLIKNALIRACTVFVVSMIAGLALMLLLRMSIFEGLRARLVALLTLNPGLRSRSRVQQASLQLSRQIHTTLTSLGFSCPRGTPLRTHLGTLDASSMPDHYPPLLEGTNLLYSQAFAQDPQQIGFVEHAHQLIAALRAIR